MTRSRTSKLSQVGGKELPPISLADIKKVKLKSTDRKKEVKVIDRCLLQWNLQIKSLTFIKT